MSISMADLDARLTAHQKALETIVGVIAGVDPRLSNALKSALRNAANELPDGVAKDTFAQILPPA